MDNLKDIMKWSNKLSWKIKTLYWYFFERNNYYCPIHHTKLKNKYCKKCDIVYWRGSCW